MVETMIEEQDNETKNRGLTSTEYLRDGFDEADAIIGSFDLSEAVTEELPVVLSGAQ